ncbi:hypothetical protein WI665_15475 [Vibrio cholerae]
MTGLIANKQARLNRLPPSRLSIAAIEPPSAHTIRPLAAYVNSQRRSSIARLHRISRYHTACGFIPPTDQFTGAASGGIANNSIVLRSLSYPSSTGLDCRALQAAHQKHETTALTRRPFGRGRRFENLSPTTNDGRVIATECGDTGTTATAYSFVTGQTVPGQPQNAF